MKPHFFQYKDLIERSLQEDLPGVDWTGSVLDDSAQFSGKIIAKQQVVCCGVELLKDIANFIDPKLHIDCQVNDGATLEQREVMATITGPLKKALVLERLALNLMARLSGIATETRRYVDLLQETGVKLLDTRKTTPGLRILEKYATRVGGGESHRWNLSDGVLIKENHLRNYLVNGKISIVDYVSALRKNIPVYMNIEVEVNTLAQVKSAIDAGVDAMLLDNMSLADMSQAVELARPVGIKLEASGNITFDTIRAVAATGVDYISTGATVHSAKWADLSMLADEH